MIKVVESNNTDKLSLDIDVYNTIDNDSTIVEVSLVDDSGTLSVQLINVYDDKDVAYEVADKLALLYKDYDKLVSVAKSEGFTYVGDNKLSESVVTKFTNNISTSDNSFSDLDHVKEILQTITNKYELSLEVDNNGLYYIRLVNAHQYYDELVNSFTKNRIELDPNNNDVLLYLV